MFGVHGPFLLAAVVFCIVALCVGIEILLRGGR